MKDYISNWSDLMKTIQPADQDLAICICPEKRELSVDATI